MSSSRKRSKQLRLTVIQKDYQLEIHKVKLKVRAQALSLRILANECVKLYAMLEKVQQGLEVSEEIQQALQHQTAEKYKETMENYLADLLKEEDK